MTVSDGPEHGKIAVDVDMLLREYIWDIYRPLRLNGMEYEVTGCDDTPGYGDDDNMLVLLTRKHDGKVVEVAIDVTIRPGREVTP